ENSSSATQKVTVTSTQSVPDAPGSFTAEQIAGTDQVLLKWTHEAGTATGFRIKREKKHKKRGWMNLTQLPDADSTARDYTDASGTGEFLYQIQAYNAAGNSVWFEALPVVVSSSGGGDGGTINCRKKKNRNEPECNGES
ncbi:MAG: hypothetical protein V3R81_13550, partial [Gammaproteobacteria bacterium]